MVINNDTRLIIAIYAVLIGIFLPIKLFSDGHTENRTSTGTGTPAGFVRQPTEQAPETPASSPATGDSEVVSAFGEQPAVSKPTAPLPEQVEWKFGTPLLGIGDPEANPYDGIVWKHGDISWLPRLARIAGWEPEHYYKLGKIILKESGGCPYRIGGDRVNKNCEVVDVVAWHHRSDTGLMQINGVNWDPNRVGRNGQAIVCKKMNVCDQESLMDPITNLKAGKLLFDSAGGWGPWDPCQWGPKYAKLCRQYEKMQEGW